MSEFTIYTKEFCPYCDKAKALLKIKKFTFAEINITDKPEELKKMLAKSNGKRTFPQIFRGDKHIGGCDDLHEYLGVK